MAFFSAARVAAAGAILCAFPVSVLADELRVGVGRSGHDLVITDEIGKEQGVAATAEYLFDSPRALRFLGGPRPYVGTMLSLEGYTNFLQAGLNWRLERGRFYADLGGGGAVHDGHLDLPQPVAGLSAEENERRRALNADRVRFGKRVLFHASLTAGVRVTDNLAVEVGAQHWSNGNVHSPVNDGSDILHLRTAYRF